MSATNQNTECDSDDEIMKVDNLTFENFGNNLNQDDVNFGLILSFQEVPDILANC